VRYLANPRGRFDEGLDGIGFDSYPGRRTPPEQLDMSTQAGCPGLVFLENGLLHYKFPMWW